MISVMSMIVLGFGAMNAYGSEFNEAAPEATVKEVEIKSQPAINLKVEEIVIDKFKGSDYISFDVTDPEFDTTECASAAASILEGFSEFLDGFEFVSIHDDSTLRRGLSNGPQVYMLCMQDTEEFSNVLVHELGHTIDLMHMEGSDLYGRSSFMDFDDPVWSNDPSVKFYNISWVNESEIKSEANRRDFVSGYAMTDPFEDFAETFAMYVEYGEIFRFLIENEENSLLKDKYFFMKYVVFEGEEFGLDKEISLDAIKYFWTGTSDLFDVTKLHNLV